MKNKIIFFSILLIVLILVIIIIYGVNKYINFRSEMDKENELFKERVIEYINENFTSEIEIFVVGRMLGSRVLTASVRSVDTDVYFFITEVYSLDDDYYENYFAKLLWEKFLPYAEDIYSEWNVRGHIKVESKTFGKNYHSTLKENADLEDVKSKIQRRFYITFYIDKELKINDDNEKIYNLLNQIKECDYIPTDVSFNFKKKGEKNGVYYFFTIKEIMGIDNIDDFNEIMQNKIDDKK